MIPTCELFPNLKLMLDNYSPIKSSYMLIIPPIKSSYMWIISPLKAYSNELFTGSSSFLMDSQWIFKDPCLSSFCWSINEIFSSVSKNSWYVNTSVWIDVKTFPAKGWQAWKVFFCRIWLSQIFLHYWLASLIRE